MIDDEERRRIAGRLRYRASIWQTAYDYGACPEPYSAGLMRVLRDEVTDAIGIDRLSPPDRILERLAELAERPECENLSTKPADELCVAPAKTATPDSARPADRGREMDISRGSRIAYRLRHMETDSDFYAFCADLCESRSAYLREYFRALADAIESERDRALRLIPENEDDVETCPHCGRRYMIAWPAAFGCMEFGTVEYCPNCGKRPADHPSYLSLGEQNMKKAMISQPMAGKTDEEIVEDRERAVAALTAMGYEVINTYFSDEWYSDKAMEGRGVVQIPLCYLAKSLENMALCHAAYFVKGWEDARGCKIEHEVAEAYGLEVIHE